MHVVFKKKMTKDNYINEFGYEILEGNEILLRFNMYVLYFMKAHLKQSELPGYNWN